MNNSLRIFNLDEAKIQAQILLKQATVSDQIISHLAAQRFLPVLQKQNLSLLPHEFQLKHALAVIAHEHGFENWTNLKNYFTTTSKSIFTPQGGFFNQWFSKYAEAKQMLSQSGGYLLPYKNQFFICEAGFIEYVGLNAQASEWQKIGYNWVEPQDFSTWQILKDKYEQLQVS